MAKNFPNQSRLKKIHLAKFSQQISSLCTGKPFECKYKFAFTSPQTLDSILNEKRYIFFSFYK